MDCKERAVQGLVHGQEFAIQLQILLNGPHHCDHDHHRHHELVSKILSSFTEAISILTTTAESSDLASVCESKKRTKEKRGCYKRKKNSESWTVVSNTMEDGHAWRKYGQKEILNAKHPRSYFRCRHKGCKASKQVQRTEADSELLCITYIGEHSCRDIISFPQTDDICDYVMNPVANDDGDEEEVIKQEESDYPSDITESDLVLWKDFVATCGLDFDFL